jgi:lipoprotein-anchoring transpeptidase ErfK/SrfK
MLSDRAHSIKMRPTLGDGGHEDGSVVRMSTMRGKFLVAAVLAAVVGSAALAPKAAQAHGDMVMMREAFQPGTIVVRTAERRLYYVIGYGQAIRYPVGVGRAGKQWSGVSYIDAKYHRPAWSPPAVVRQDHPGLPSVIAGGSPRNPMGVAAMSLAGGEYAIHGTNQPGSIGHFVSYGCIRMLNEDITDLFDRVSVGTQVVVQ